jgi:hypothetical protein
VTTQAVLADRYAAGYSLGDHAAGVAEIVGEALVQAIYDSRTQAERTPADAAWDAGFVQGFYSAHEPHEIPADWLDLWTETRSWALARGL